MTGCNLYPGLRDKERTYPWCSTRQDRGTKRNTTEMLQERRLPRWLFHHKYSRWISQRSILSFSLKNRLHRESGEEMQKQFLRHSFGDGTLPQAIHGGTRLTGVGGAQNIFSDLFFVTASFAYSRWRSTVTDGVCWQTHLARHFSHALHTRLDNVNHTTRLKCLYVSVTPYSCHPWWAVERLSVVVSSFWLSPCLSFTLLFSSHFNLYSVLTLFFHVDNAGGKHTLRLRQSRSLALWQNPLLPHFSPDAGGLHQGGRRGTHSSRVDKRSQQRHLSSTKDNNTFIYNDRENDLDSDSDMSKDIDSDSDDENDNDDHKSVENLKNQHAATKTIQFSFCGCFSLTDRLQPGQPDSAKRGIGGPIAFQSRSVHVKFTSKPREIHNGARRGSTAGETRTNRRRPPKHSREFQDEIHISNTVTRQFITYFILKIL